MTTRRLDIFHLLITGLTLVGWGTLIYALVVFDDARPEMATIITQYHQIQVRTFWLVSVYDRLVWLLWFCALVSITNLGINIYLKRWAKETNWLSPVLLSVVSVVAILVLSVWQPHIAH